MADSNCAFVRVERRSACAWVTLDRPPLNLIVPEMIRGIKGAFDELREDSKVRAAVLTGRGRATTAGMQLQFLRELPARDAKAFIEAGDAKRMEEMAAYYVRTRLRPATGRSEFCPEQPS